MEVENKENKKFEINETINLINELSINETKVLEKIEYFINDTASEQTSKELIIENIDDNFLVITTHIFTTNETYQNSFSISDLVNLSHYFNFLALIASPEKSPIEVIQTFLRNNLDSNLKNSIKFELNSKNTSEISLIFTFSYCNFTKESIIFPLRKNNSQNSMSLVTKEENMLINLLIRSKKNKLSRLKFLKKKLEKEISKTNSLKQTLEKCNVYFGQDMTIKMSFVSLGLDTDIFMNFDEYNFIAETIKTKLKKDDISFNQIFKASCNGDNCNAFHSHCDGISNTLILILTDEKRRIGGFTQALWDKSNSFKSDENAFLFSLDNFEIYNIKKEYKDKAIMCYEDFYSPVFGDDLFIFDGFFSSKLSKSKEEYYDYSESRLDEKYKLTGQDYFTVSEMEVYEILFR